MSNEVWDDQKRARATKDLIREAKNMIRRLKLKGVVVIGFWPAEDDDHIHMIDAAVGCPVPADQLYKNLLTAYAIKDESEGKDVRIQ